VSDKYRKDPEAISQLTREQYQVTQQAATEPAFRNDFCDELDRQGHDDYHHLFDNPEEAAR
jgi:peptide methionine sulfoxide reductase MsrB